MNGKDRFFKDQGAEGPVGNQGNLRTIFCDGDERSLVSPAQRAANRECQHPQQSRPLPTDPFEPHGMN